MIVRLIIGFLLLLTTAQLLWASVEQSIEQGVDLLKRGQAAEALELFLDAAEHSVSPDQLNPLIAAAYLQLGHNALKNGDLNAAREAFETGRPFAPDDHRFSHGLGFVWYRQGQYPMAAYELQDALVLSGDRADLLTLLGQVQYAQGDLWQATASWERARELAPSRELDQLIVKARNEQAIEDQMRRDVRGRFTLSFVEGTHGALASDVLEVLNDAYNDIGSDLGFYPDTDVPVLLYAATDFASVTRSPDWAGAIYDGKIRIPLGGLDRMTDRLRALLYHEYAHVVVRFMANNRAPTWLNEGIAEIYERRYHDEPLRTLHVAVRRGQLLDLALLEKSFQKLPDDRVKLAYEQSYSLVAHLVDQHGWHGVARLLQALAGGMSTQAAFDASLYGQGWQFFYADWQAGLQP